MPPSQVPSGTPVQNPIHYLPDSMQAGWLVLPRELAYWIVVQAATLGAGLALSIGGFIAAEHAGWRPAFVVALLVATVNGFILKRRERSWRASVPKRGCPNDEPTSLEV